MYENYANLHPINVEQVGEEKIKWFWGYQFELS